MFLAACPVQIRDVKLTNSTAGGFNGNLLFLEREPESGFVSKTILCCEGPIKQA